MLESKPKKFTYFIGIDVSRNELDYAVMQGKKFLFHKEALNGPASIIEFVNELKNLPKFTITRAVFCMEQTGIYCNHLLNSLKKLKANVVLENPLKIRNSLGLIRGKYDKIDAIRIAQFAYTNRENLNVKVFKRPILVQLSNLFAVRNRLLSLQVALKTPLKEQTEFVKKNVQKVSVNACKRSIEALKEDLGDIEKSIDELIKSDERLHHLNEIITSVPSVGRITSIHVILSTNEFKDIKDPKKFACYAGVAPFKKESGLMKGKARVSHIANKKVKSVLHVCAVNTLRGKSEFRKYYDRKIAEGKPKMAVINAVRNKLILRIFACLNQNRLYSKDYVRETNLQQT